MVYKHIMFIADYFKRSFIQELKNNQKELPIAQYEYTNNKQLVLDIFKRELAGEEGDLYNDEIFGCMFKMLHKYIDNKQLVLDIFGRKLTDEENDLYDEIFGFIYKMLYDTVITLDDSLINIIHFVVGYTMSSSLYIKHRNGEINILEELSTKGCITAGQPKHNLDETISKINLDKFLEWSESTGMFSTSNNPRPFASETPMGITPVRVDNFFPITINVFECISKVQVVESYNFTDMGEPFKSYHLNCTLDFDLKNSDTVSMDIIGRALECFIYIKRRELRYLNNSRALYIARQSKLVPKSNQLKDKIMGIDSCVVDKPILDGIEAISEMQKSFVDDEF